MLVNETCKVLCTSTYNKANARFMSDRISENYMVNW
jgi:hypothetical protein